MTRKKLAWFSVLLVVALASTAGECDPAAHAAYTANQEAVGLCKARGGIPIVEAQNDDDGHYFTVLQHCEFPCDKRLEVEK